MFGVFGAFVCFRLGPSARPKQHYPSTHGPLVDTGAVRPFTGLVFVESQVKAMSSYGFNPIGSDLPEVERASGVGAGIQICRRKVKLVSVLEYCRLLVF